MLAAGRSSRFGSNKLLQPTGDGDTLLVRALRACGAYPALVVTSSETAKSVSDAGVSIVINDEPERGMTHSLRVGHAQIDERAAIAVLPADLMYVTPAGVASIVEQSRGADVAFPSRGDGRPGHPVVFSPRARSYIDALPDGDTVHELRDRAGLIRRVLRIEEAWPYHDVDTASDFTVT